MWSYWLVSVKLRHRYIITEWCWRHVSPPAGLAHQQVAVRPRHPALQADGGEVRAPPTPSGERRVGGGGWEEGEEDGGSAWGQSVSGRQRADWACQASVHAWPLAAAVCWRGDAPTQTSLVSLVSLISLSFLIKRTDTVFYNKSENHRKSSGGCRGRRCRSVASRGQWNEALCIVLAIRCPLSFCGLIWNTFALFK